MTERTSSIDRFSGRVADYVQFRPGYPEAVYDRLQAAWSLTGNETVADVGCGPGTSARLFLNHGHKVVGVEPLAAMRAAAKEIYTDNSHFSIVEGSAEATTLPASSVDFAIVAQALHWVDIPAARHEFLRILRPPKRVAVLWNTLRSDTPFLAEYEQLLQLFGTDYRDVHHKNLGADSFRMLFGEGWQECSFRHVHELDQPGLVGRVRSSSFMPNHEHPRYAEMMAALAKLYQRHCQNGLVQFVYDAELYFGQLTLTQPE